MNLLCSSSYFQTSSSLLALCESTCTPTAPSASRLSSHDTLTPPSIDLCSSRTSLYSLCFSERWMARQRMPVSHDLEASRPRTATFCGNLLSLVSWLGVSQEIAWNDSAASPEISFEEAAAAAGSELATSASLLSRQRKWVGTECLNCAPSESPIGAEVLRVSLNSRNGTLNKIY